MITPSSVTEIKEGAFLKCTSLKKIFIPWNERAIYISNHFSDKYGGKWTCFVGKLFHMEASCWFNYDHYINYIHLRYGNKDIYLFEG